MIKYIKISVYSLLVLLIVLISLISFFLTTTPGLYTAITIARMYLPGTLKVHQLEGSLLDRFTIGTLDYQNGLTRLSVNGLSVDWQAASLLHKQVIIHQMHAQSMVIEHNSSHQTVTNIDLSADLNQKTLNLKQVEFDYLKQAYFIQLQADTQGDHALSGTIKVDPQQSRSGEIKISGDLDHIRWIGNLHSPGEIALQGSFIQKSALTQNIQWHDLHWKLINDTYNSPKGTIKITGTLPALKLEFDGQLNNLNHDHWLINAGIQGIFPWKWTFDASLEQLYKPTSPKTGLYTKLMAKGSITAKTQGVLDVTILPGLFQMPADSPITTLPFKGGKIHFDLSPQQLEGKGLITLDQNQDLTASLHLPQFDSWQRICQQPTPLSRAIGGI